MRKKNWLILLCAGLLPGFGGCLAAMHFRHCRGSALWPMLAGSIPGSFAGLYILQICSGAVLQGAVGLLLIYYVYWQKTFRVQGVMRHPRLLGASAGFGGTGSFGISLRPPIRSAISICSLSVAWISLPSGT